MAPSHFSNLTFFLQETNPSRKRPRIEASNDQIGKKDNKQESKVDEDGDNVPEFDAVDFESYEGLLAFSDDEDEKEEEEDEGPKQRGEWSDFSGTDDSYSDDYSPDLSSSELEYGAKNEVSDHVDNSLDDSGAEGFSETEESEENVLFTALYTGCWRILTVIIRMKMMRVQCLWNR